jgi:hypothetical protein
VRKAIWASPDARLKLDIIELGEDMNNGRMLGPWGYLYDERTQQQIGAPTPQTLLILSDSDTDWEEWTRKEGV